MNPKKQFLMEDQSEALKQYGKSYASFTRLEVALTNGDFRKAKQEAVNILNHLNELETMEKRKETHEEIDVIISSLKAKGVNVEKMLLKKGEF